MKKHGKRRGKDGLNAEWNGSKELSPAAAFWRFNQRSTEKGAQPNPPDFLKNSVCFVCCHVLDAKVERVCFSPLKQKKMIAPKDIPTNHYFMGSPFQNSECETILRNIVLLQKSVNADEWTGFSWEQYKAFCTHSVTESERGVLNAFVNGGKPVFNTSAYLDSGWLDYGEKSGKYFFTAKMIQMLADNYAEKQVEQ